VLVLAASLGKRLNSSLPKVLTPVLFRPLVHYALDLVAGLPHQSVGVIVAPGDQDVRERCRPYEGLQFLRQGPHGETLPALRAAEAHMREPEADVLVLRGDMVYLEAEPVRELLARHARARALCTVGEGALCFRKKALLSAAAEAAAKAGKEGNLFVEAAHALASGRGRSARPGTGAVLAVNDLLELCHAEEVLRERINRAWLGKGVFLQDPRSTFIDPRTSIGRDVRIEAGTFLINSVLEPGVKVEGSCRIVDSQIGEGTTIKQGSYIEKSHVGHDCRVGPYAHLRPGTHLENAVSIGNFVEVKKSFIGTGTKASHLSYIGDAQVGMNVNVGCGFITCNFDGGPVKQRTIIEDFVFIGSDSQTVAPVKLGARSYVASGTTVTENVPPDSFAISRGRQVTKVGYAKKYRRKPSAAAHR
jgi:bifunctional UDP-N-acetylglucosamine pyrophosphorylase/glucosamine-1-phosphate N-acetyltransferase